MKTIFTFILVVIFSLTTFAQDKIYVHTATAENILTFITYLDHPDLNNNPGAGVVFSHVSNPNGAPTQNNNHIDGLAYDGTVNKWAIINEDLATIQEGAHYFIYIASIPSQVITHIASTANEHPSGAYYSVIDDPNFNNNNPGPFAIMSNYNTVSANNHNYGFWYDSTIERRVIFSEDGADIPLNTGFKILKSTVGAITSFTHQATASNTNGITTTINNSDLNNNPNATFVFSHYWGVLGPSSEVSLDSKFSAWYNTTENRWMIYSEDASNIPLGIAFDIIVAEQEVLGVNDISQDVRFGIYPNPATDIVKISSKQNQTITDVAIYNILGQKTASFNNQEGLSEISVKELNAGVYLLNIKDINGNVGSIKLIKK